MGSSRPVVLSLAPASLYSNIRATRSAESVPFSLTSGPSAPSTVSLSDTPSLRRPRSRSQSLERGLPPPSPKGDLPYEIDLDRPQISPTVSFHSYSQSHVSTPTVRSFHRRRDSGSPVQSTPRPSYDRPRESPAPHESVHAPSRLANSFAPPRRPHYVKKRLRVDSGNALPISLSPPSGFPYRNSSMLGVRQGPKQSLPNQVDSDEDVDLDLSWETSVDIVVDVDGSDESGALHNENYFSREGYRAGRLRRSASASEYRDRALSVDIGVSGLSGQSDDGLERGGRSAPLHAPSDWAQGWSYNRTAPVSPSEIAESSEDHGSPRRRSFPLNLLLDRDKTKSALGIKTGFSSRETGIPGSEGRSKPASSGFPFSYIFHPFQRPPTSSSPSSPGLTSASASPLFQSPLTSPTYTSPPTSPDYTFSSLSQGSPLSKYGHAHTMSSPLNASSHARSTSVSFANAGRIIGNHAHSMSSPVTPRRRIVGESRRRDGPMGPYVQLATGGDSDRRSSSPEPEGFSAFTTPKLENRAEARAHARIPTVKISTPDVSRPSPSSGSKSKSTPSTGRTSRSIATSLWTLTRPSKLRLVESDLDTRSAMSKRQDGDSLPSPHEAIHVHHSKERQSWWSPSRIATSMDPLADALDASVPARTLFFFGFLFGPWCWLLGALYLRRVDGEFYGLQGNVCRCGAVVAMRAPGSSSSTMATTTTANGEACKCIAERARALRVQGIAFTGRGVDMDGGERLPLDMWVGANMLASGISGLVTLGVFVAALQAIVRSW
jgi:hypothetical protein